MLRHVDYCIRFSIFFFLNSFIIASPVSAKESSTQELNPIIVAAKRSVTDLSNTAESATVYSASYLKQLPAHDLAEALSYLPGVTIQPSGFFGQSTAVSMRGADSRQVLVMVDGIPFNTQLTGQANLSRIPLDNIKQVEIIKGGASSVWGSSLGGVINVVTKNPSTVKGIKGYIKSSYGSFGTTKNSIELMGNKGKFGVFADFSYLNSGGYLADSYTKEAKSFNKLSYDFNDETQLTASYGFSGAQMRYGPTNTRRLFEQPYTTRFGQVNLTNGDDDQRFDIAYKYNLQDISSGTYNSSNHAGVSTAYSNNLFQGLSILNHHAFTANHELNAGFDADWQTIKSTQYLRESKSVSKQAPFLNYQWRMDNLDLQPAIRYDRNSHFGSQVSPAFGVVYHIEGWQEALIKARVARVFNAPPLLWLYNDDATLLVAPNIDLKAERANTFELGAQFRLFNRFKFNADAYLSQVNDGIAVVSSGGSFQSQNFRKINRRGGSLLLDYQINQDFNVDIGGEFNDVYNEQTKKLIRDAGIARHAIKGGMHYHTPFGLGINLMTYYTRSMASPSQARDRKPLFDLHLTQSILNDNVPIDVEIFVDVHNLTNSSYWLSPTFPYPGRYYEGGLTINF